MAPVSLLLIVVTVQTGVNVVASLIFGTMAIQYFPALLLMAVRAVRSTAWETPFSAGQPVIVERVPYCIAVDPVGGRATLMVASCVSFVPYNGVPGTKDHVPARIFAPVLLGGKG